MNSRAVGKSAAITQRPIIWAVDIVRCPVTKLSFISGTTTMPGSNRPSAGAANSIFFIENGPQITANGTRPNSNLIQLDGVGLNSASWGGSAVLTPNEESIKEITVIANSYSAENGRNSGAQIMVISKNGQPSPRQRILQVAPPGPECLPALERPRQSKPGKKGRQPLQSGRR